ncbi:hypothetical protein NEOLEDRAFT_1133302 [Neolentinus lepideus HHB14362 ss-1]|uniref:Uncharacterized protein n=1 Tax=Neolentinus lepideus HHB14362 ss-1 TaxID=1314782 RepID=A0A165SW56_9AGAM|nr:hypothetical protein NEOLEDRAFT_1133302 [Neolentinus lepideus HHB14362 ss-1]
MDTVPWAPTHIAYGPWQANIDRCMHLYTSRIDELSSNGGYVLVYAHVALFPNLLVRRFARIC